MPEFLHQWGTQTNSEMTFNVEPQKKGNETTRPSSNLTSRFDFFRTGSQMQVVESKNLKISAETGREWHTKTPKNMIYQQYTI